MPAPYVSPNVFHKLTLLGFAISGLLHTCTAVPAPPISQTPLLSSSPSSNPASQAIRIMPLGDSITQANSRYNSYRRLLWLRLRQAGYDVDFVGSKRSHVGGSAPLADFDQDHEGHWGWRIGAVLQQVDRWAKNAQPDIVLIHLGTNDIGRQPPEQSIEELSQVIQSLRQVNPNVTVLLAQLIPVVGAESEVRQFNQQVVRLASSINTNQSLVIAVDQFSEFDVRRDTYDGVHPNASGEQKLAERWFMILRQVLDRGKVSGN